MNASFQAIVEKHAEIAPGAFVLSFKRNFEFEAGQVIGITLDPKQEPRLYSIASGNKAASVDILYTVNPDGLLTPALSRLREGDRFFHTEPFGKFTCTDTPALWIATGTGIAPFASMLFSGLGGGKTLVYGNRDMQHLYFHSRLKEALGGDRYFPCTSRVAAPEAFHGRVTAFLQASRDQALPGTFLNSGMGSTGDGRMQDLPCYVCGSAEMVVDVRDLLIEMGWPFDRIFAEIFF